MNALASFAVAHVNSSAAFFQRAERSRFQPAWRAQVNSPSTDEHPTRRDKHSSRAFRTRFTCAPGQIPPTTSPTSTSTKCLVCALHSSLRNKPSHRTDPFIESADFTPEHERESERERELRAKTGLLPSQANITNMVNGPCREEHGKLHTHVCTQERLGGTSYSASRSPNRPASQSFWVISRRTCVRHRGQCYIEECSREEEERKHRWRQSSRRFSGTYTRLSTTH